MAICVSGCSRDADKDEGVSGTPATGNASSVGYYPKTAVACSASMHQLGMGLVMYAADNRDYLPERLEQITAYFPDEKEPAKLLSCQGRRYVYLLDVPLPPGGKPIPRKMSGFRQFTQTPAVWEEIVHGDRGVRNVLFLDGHVEQLSPLDFGQKVLDPVKALQAGKELPS